jgi:hypothetical protein
MSILTLAIESGALLGLPVLQNRASAQQTIGRIDNKATAQEVKVSGAITLQGSTMLLGNGSTVTAGQHTLTIQLTRGGNLDLCATTSVHLSQQKSAVDPNSPLMMALDRGALEAHYTLGKDSDVVLTPDLRILLSGPGQADVRIRVNNQGDTCVENHGANAPYVTVSEQMGTGVYRVQPNQRVLFEHGSLQAVVDNETEPCGCPAAPVISIASAGSTSNTHAAQPGHAVAVNSAPANTGPSSTPADTAFPIAESEGLASPPGPPTKPVVPPGQVHAEVSTTLAYSGPENKVSSPATSGPAISATDATASNPSPNIPADTSSNSATATTTAQAPPPKPKPSSGSFLHHIGHFFARIFGKG